MSESEIRVGGYFSRNYRTASAPSTDSTKARFRIAKYLEEYTAGDSGSFGRYIEKELGIKIVKIYQTAYVSWEEALLKCSIVEFLDIVTAIAIFCPTRIITSDRVPVRHEFIPFVSRVLREEQLAYRIDEKGGVHPFVDATFTGQLSEILLNFSRFELTAARNHILDAESALLASQFDGRKAVRSIFDAVENLFKLICTGATQLNSSSIRDRLAPIVLSLAADSHQKRFTGKILDSLADWVDAGHFYRHEPGKPEPTEPSSTLAILYVSSGLGFARWLGEIHSLQKANS
jgi:hypothetical protein